MFCLSFSGLRFTHVFRTRTPFENNCRIWQQISLMCAETIFSTHFAVFFFFFFTIRPENFLSISQPSLKFSTQNSTVVFFQKHNFFIDLLTSTIKSTSNSKLVTKMSREKVTTSRYQFTCLVTITSLCKWNLYIYRRKKKSKTQNGNIQEITNIVNREPRYQKNGILAHFCSVCTYCKINRPSTLFFFEH